jgi:plasmid stabilization system protein ParE
VASILVAPAARRNLDRIITTHALPPDTRERVRNRIEPLSEFPLLGSPLEGRWEGMRFILGPWSWMLIVYGYDPERDQVQVFTVEDARTASSATSSR